MGIEFKTIREEPTSEWLAEGQTDWRTACELLKTSQYERVVELLGEAQAVSEQTGDASLARILAAASRICLACSQCRAEAEWHWRAYQEANQREHKLRQQLHAILALISGGEAPETREVLSTVPMADLSQPECNAPESAQCLSLWQRIQDPPRRELAPRFTKREVSVVHIETPTLLSAERAEASIATPKKEKRQEEVPSLLVVYCLGPFRVCQNDQLITDWDSLKARSIFKYLVVHRGTPIIKDILMDIFWPDADPEAARRNLHQAIYSLRQTLRRGQPDSRHIQFENDCYLLNPEMDIWLDCEEFEKHVQVGRRLEAAGRLREAMVEYSIAEGLYQGDFLEEDLYEDWPTLQREHIRNLHLDIADRLSEYYVQQGEYTAAIALCRKILVQDNCYEEAHRRLMQCYLAQGQRHLAVRQYQTCTQALSEELDLSPLEETVALYRCITATA